MVSPRGGLASIDGQTGYLDISSSDRPKSRLMASRVGRSTGCLLLIRDRPWRYPIVNTGGWPDTWLFVVRLHELATWRKNEEILAARKAEDNKERVPSSVHRSAGGRPFRGGPFFLAATAVFRPIDCLGNGGGLEVGRTTGA